MRTFVALNLAPQLRASIHAAAQPLRDLAGRGVSWVAEPALHVTLKFLGQREEAFVDHLVQRLAPALRSRKPVQLRLGGVGAFPSMSRPRVIWLGVAENPAVARLYQEVDDACAALGAAREQRAFHPHVTLGRVRDGATFDTRALARAASNVTFRADARVESADVMESVLGPGGARYRAAAALALHGHEEG